MSATAAYNFKCDYCNKSYIREAFFLKHKCKERQRIEDFKSITGKSAWQYYKLWMKSHNRPSPNPNSFLSSQYFNTFLKFAKFVKQVKLPNVDVFIRLMGQKDYPPVMWTMDETYQRYLEYLDFQISPDKMAATTIKQLWDIAELCEVDIGDVFNEVTGNDVIQLLRQRRLSPWILLQSSKFTKFYANTSLEERIIIETLILPAHWMEQFKKKPEIVEKMKKLVLELNL